MTRFARLFAAIDATTSTNAKVQAMVDYLAAASPRDAAWAVFFLTGRRFKRLIASRALGTWASDETGTDEWLMRECLSVVGDSAETAALVLDRIPATAEPALSLSDWIEGRIVPLRNRPAAEQRRQVMAWIRELDRWERFTLFKLLTGELRVGVSHGLVVRAVAAVATLPVATIAARMTGDWQPSAEWYAALVAAADDPADHLRPYPFFLASPVDDASPQPDDLETLLGPAPGWLVEWKWDGIRAQLVKRHGQLRLWSRGEELITERFPEVIAAAAGLPEGLVLDGEILAYRADRPLPFSALQQRIGRQQQVARLAREIPAVFMAYDVLEHNGIDIRERPLSQRRALLESVVAAAGPAPGPSAEAPPDRLPFPGDEDSGDDHPAATLVASAQLQVADWHGAAALRAGSRSRGVEGLMLKRWSSPYRAGRKRGDWWKWKIEPYTIDAVLIYAQPGSGKRASLLTDYTFAVWHGGELIPVAKAYSGLTNDEITEVDRWIRRHTIERFGPVRHVMPVQVFELGFEAIARSTRHRSGVAVRFPRMLRWRKDKAATEADTLEQLLAMIEADNR